MNLHVVLIVFQIVVLLFAISLHEAAHGWTAWRLGDPTARMLGRVTLNPLVHIELFGTILIPMMCVFFGFPLIGWAKPTPITTRNFKHVKRDDILTTLAGPASNLLSAMIALVVLILLKLLNANTVMTIVMAAQAGRIDAVAMNGSPVLVPVTLLMYYAVLLNLMLMAFNLIPVPPLDGGQVVRNVLPYNWLRYYDRFGLIGLLLIFLFGGRFILSVVNVFLAAFNHVLMAL